MQGLNPARSMESEILLIAMVSRVLEAVLDIFGAMLVWEIFS